jgi:hypothetical protein
VCQSWDDHLANHSIVSGMLERPYVVLESEVGRKCREHRR